MPTIPKVTIDRREKKVYLDGVELPWWLDERGPTVENPCSAHEIPVVCLPILASDLQVIPAEADDA